MRRGGLRQVGGRLGAGRDHGRRADAITRRKEPSPRRPSRCRRAPCHPHATCNLCGLPVPRALVRGTPSRSHVTSPPPETARSPESGHVT
ncbi:Hypothetical protein CAP_7573 [Chondromyces apiculatus DSM 436]|uniref:Uncharacterized protein n=1 Tax=Chondromyces apiculatus DSM 436 TaxID=1192034 RepID=A0A017SZC7_9BACT|nr:Hypothetical protein CAP_7573 [Chondromyces apiculatus DSM 436]